MRTNMERDKEKFYVKISDEKRDALIESIQVFCENELDLEIGNLGSSSLYDHVLQELGKVIYNKAIEDAKEYYQSRHNEIDIDTYSLIK